MALAVDTPAHSGLPATESAAGWELPAGALPAHPPGRVAPELVGYFASQLAGHYRADMYLGPHMLIGTVAEQYRLILRLAADAELGVREGLLRLGVAYAALAGWLCQDVGALAQSAYWRAETLEVAHRVQDAQLIGYALVNKAMLATERGDGRATLDLAAAALAGERALAPKVRVLARQQAAHGHSLTPGPQARPAVDRLIDEAALITANVDDDAPWGNACRRTPMYTEVQRATCYGRLGLSEDAARLWERILPHVPQSARRDAGVYRARHAAALAQCGSPDHAVKFAADVAQLVRDTGSARMRRELFVLRQVMRPWRTQQSGRDLEDILASASAR